ncbi:MAG TPA: MBL fold metallo-hydrolase [Opitutaceae bacterium]|nr:MBL fold metallo-hydrolase [Opitutaceae bacterium]
MPLRGNVGYATGRGGTIGWLCDQHALVAVDAQFPETAQQFIDGLPGRGGREFDQLINTHYHGDHTAGNSAFRPVTRSIIAHANVPALQRGRSKTPDTETVADTTFTDQWRRDFGGETVAARHFGPAHTRGDIVVHFERANVVHLGDLVFNRLYPVIDRPGGASIAGWIETLETLAKTYPTDALYVFGHGTAQFGVTGTAADLGVMRDFLTALLEHTQREIRAGKARDEIVRLTEFPGFPDHRPAPGSTSRLPADLGVAYDELTAER